MAAAPRRKRAAGSDRRPLVLAAWLLACGVTPPGEEPASEAEPAAEHDAALQGLVAYEQAKRASLDHAHVQPWSRRSGADPSALLAEDGGTVLGLLREGRVVRLDADARPIAEGATLRGATDLVRAKDDLLVVAEGDGRIDVLDPSSLARRRTIEVAEVHSIRAAAFGPEGRLYITDPHRHRVLALSWPPRSEPAVATEVAACHGALKIQRTGGWLVHACLLDHEVVVRTTDERGTLGPPAAVHHDGPIWSFDAVESEGGGLRLLLGGVEDRPLDRSDGAFGYIDSFAFVVDVEPSGGDAAPRMLPRGSTNLSALGVVTPKHVAWLPSQGGVASAFVTGYGGDRAATLRWPHGLSAASEAVALPVPPGITSLVQRPGAGFIAADALLDAWLVDAGTGKVRVIGAAAEPDGRTASERLGEALAFTTLMAPGGTSEGKRSRFTCETCHFEGRVDGRVHFTGRGDVHATTKTLRGLFPNRPHFSRALDRTTANMVNNEFRVASRGTGHDPWFSLDVSAQAPWLSHLGVSAGELDPVELRRALVDFFAVFTPEPNPAVRARSRLPDDARAGAELFARHCESCHSARLVADEPASRVPIEAWESLVLSETGPIVWGQEGRERTGVEPYVHPGGARVPSLRRLWVKRPYLTNGRARTIDAVLEGVRLHDDEAHEHDRRSAHGGGDGEDGRPATAQEIQALRAFLDLL